MASAANLFLTDAYKAFKDVEKASKEEGYYFIHPFDGPLTLQGSATLGLEIVEYLRDKLFAALKVPKAFLGYDESISGKATLAAEDVRFARTVERIQKIVISELTKIAIGAKSHLPRTISISVSLESIAEAPKASVGNNGNK